MMTSYPVGNKTSLSQKPCIPDKYLLITFTRPWHGRGNGFESGTAEGVEHEPPEAQTGMPKASTGYPPHQQGGLVEFFFRNLYANWCIFERKSLLKLLCQIQINIAFIACIFHCEVLQEIATKFQRLYQCFQGPTITYR